MTRVNFRLRLNLAGNDIKRRWLVLHDGRYICIDIEQSWFWTDEWQEGEQQAQREYAESNFEHFDSAEELITNLCKAD